MWLFFFFLASCCYAVIIGLGAKHEWWIVAHGWGNEWYNHLMNSQPSMEFHQYDNLVMQFCPTKWGKCFSFSSFIVSCYIKIPLCFLPEKNNNNKEAKIEGEIGVLNATTLSILSQQDLKKGSTIAEPGN